MDNHWTGLAGKLTIVDTGGTKQDGYIRWRHVKPGRNGRRISLWPFSPDDVFSALLTKKRAQEPESSKEQKGERQPDSRGDSGGDTSRRDG